MESSVSYADEGLSGVTDFRCEECGLTYKHKTLLYTYKPTHETISHECFICGKVFKLKKYLLKHIKCHYAESDYLCQICGKTYKSGHSLKVHKDTKHGPCTRYQCPKCDKKIICARRLREHIHSHDAKSHK